MTELPKGWARCVIGDVLEPVEMISNQEADREIWYADISSIDSQSNSIVSPKRLMLSDAPSRARQKVMSGDVLFSTVRPYLRKIAAVSERYHGEVASTGFAVLRGTKGIEPHYLFYKCISHDFVSALTGEQYGVSYPAVKDEQVKSQPLELPPTNEQRRIVEKIEAMFERIDKGVENLRGTKATLALYRQSLLKSAFEGKLTADWRAQNADELETPKTLLARIQKERETRYKSALDDWQTALAEWRAGGEVGRKPSKPSRPDWPTEITFQGRKPIPDSWFYLPFEAVAYSIRNGISAKPDGQGPLKIFRISAVRARAFDLMDFRRITDNDGSMEAYRLNYGDLVFTRYNGSRD